MKLIDECKDEDYIEEPNLYELIEKLMKEKAQLQKECDKLRKKDSNKITKEIWIGGVKMKKVCILVDKEKSKIMVFKDQTIAEEYLKEWGMQKFESDIWAKTEEDVKLGNYYRLLIKEVISNEEKE